jgi:ketosteroid isomerase-like protein
MSEVIDRLNAAVNAHDLEAAASCFHVDYLSEQPAHPGRAFVGRAQMHANWGAMFAGIPDIRSVVHRCVQDGDTAWVEWSWLGTRTDGQHFEMHGVCLFRIQDSHIVAGRLYMEEAERTGATIDDAVEALSGRVPRSPRSA